jgi:alpha-L-fucosidase 2
MIKKIFFFLIIPVFSIYAQSVKDIISESDVIWDTPSKKSIESMIIGNGDIGINLWAEKTGDIFIYIGKTDSWDEYARLVKVGLVKIHITPNPFQSDFYQRLDLYNGQILLESGKPENKLKMKLWVDANNPVVNIEYESKSEYTYEVSPIVWRNKIREITGTEKHSLYGFGNSNRTLNIYPDSVMNTKSDNIICYHRNSSSIWKEVLERQGMENWTENHEDPLLNNTYGYLVRGSSLKYNSGFLLESKSEKEGKIKIFAVTRKCNHFIEWLSAISDISKTYEKKNQSQYYKEHLKYWHNFWSKSYVHLYGDADAEKLSKAYTLQRFVTACAGRGKYPIKFNGSIFTVDSCDEVQKYDADYRMWGGPYWHQNTRLIYWPLLTSGDTDLMRSFFNMYIDALPFSKAYTESLFHHSGAFFPETFYFWGSYTMDNFGWKTNAKEFKHTENQYIRYHYQGSLETLAMMLEYYDFSRDVKFAGEYVLPFAKEIMTFYETHFPKDKHGKIYIYPSQALETYWDIANPACDVAGLRYNLEKLIDLPKNVIEPSLKEYFKKMLSEIPDLSFGIKDGKKILLPCEKLPEKITNSENPELYSIFPYRIYGIDKPDYNLALNTFYNCRFPYARCWQHTDVIAAYLGVTDSAKKNLIHRLDYKHPDARFPVFWGAGMDWCPDEDHGGNLMIALHAMLLQCDNEKISVLPAFPKEWNVDFKLNAPNKTVVSVSYKDGKLKKVDVMPKSRKKDIKIK